MIEEQTRAILNLGAGTHCAANAVNHDLYYHSPTIDIAWDLNVLPWPWENESFETISARAVLEHLDLTLLEALNECWRILKPGGYLGIKLPFWDSETSYNDPTHRYVVGRGVFDILDPALEKENKHFFYTDKKWSIIRCDLNNCKSSVVATLKKLSNLEVEQIRERAKQERERDSQRARDDVPPGGSSPEQQPGNQGANSALPGDVPICSGATVQPV